MHGMRLQYKAGLTCLLKSPSMVHGGRYKSNWHAIGAGKGWFQARRDANPEYYNAPRCYALNFRQHQSQLNTGDVQVKRLIELKNPRYRWADFRRRMVYGTHDI